MDVLDTILRIVGAATLIGIVALLALVVVASRRKTDGGFGKPPGDHLGHATILTRPGSDIDARVRAMLASGDLDGELFKAQRRNYERLGGRG